MSEFHIRCERKDIPPYVIIVGNPDRATRISENFLKEGKLINSYRSLLTYTGYYKDLRVTVSTTGMGAPSTAIVLEELIHLGGKVFIRVGSAGGINPEIDVGDIVVATGSIRDDGTTPKYLPLSFPAVPDFNVLSKLVKVSKEFSNRVFYGVVGSSDAFYIPYDDKTLKKLVESNVQAVEMESGCVFIVSQRRGVKSGAIFAIDGNVTLGKIKPKGTEEKYKEGETIAIKIALETLLRMYHEENKK
ncbi:MAG TPA: nucleoside phosphorylase [Firmicutes bacterium]|nr:nucleoside phosphorylase [Bacillota bacterium]